MQQGYSSHLYIYSRVNIHLPDRTGQIMGKHIENIEDKVSQGKDWKNGNVLPIPIAFFSHFWLFEQYKTNFRISVMIKYLHGGYNSRNPRHFHSTGSTIIQ